MGKFIKIGTDKDETDQKKSQRNHWVTEMLKWFNYCVQNQKMQGNNEDKKTFAEHNLLMLRNLTLTITSLPDKLAAEEIEGTLVRWESKHTQRRRRLTVNPFSK